MPRRTAPDGGMLAVLGGSVVQATALADAYGLVVANDNAPGQVVLSGPSSLIGEARRAARDDGLKALELDVAGPSTRRRWPPRCRRSRQRSRSVEWHTPAAPVISGCTATVPRPRGRAGRGDRLNSPLARRHVDARRPRDRALRRRRTGTVLERLVARNLEEADRCGQPRRLSSSRWNGPSAAARRSRASALRCPRAS